MSYVVGFAKPNYAIIMSDGRCSQNNGQKIITEFYDKTKKINPNVIIGYAGESALCEQTLEHLLKQSDVKYADHAVSVLQNFLLNLKLSSDRKCLFMVAGKSSSGCMEMYVVNSSNNAELQKHVPTNENPSIASLSPDGIDGNVYLANQINGHNRPIKESLRAAISIVASCHPTVNTNCYTQEILLEESSYPLH